MGAKGLAGDLFRYYAYCCRCGAKIPVDRRYYNEQPLCPDCERRMEERKEWNDRREEE